MKSKHVVLSCFFGRVVCSMEDWLRAQCHRGAVHAMVGFFRTLFALAFAVSVCVCVRNSVTKGPAPTSTALHVSKAGGWSASQESPANEDALLHAVQTYLQTSSWVLSAQLDWSKKFGHFSVFPNKVFRQ